MKIISLVENTTKSELKAKHGLALYIETEFHKILFDVGSDETLFENAAKRNIALSEVDTVIISHGHIDHGGSLKLFLEMNQIAKVYVQRLAFEPHYSRTLFFNIPVGLDTKMKTSNRVVLVDGDYTIDEELFLFTVSDCSKCYSPVNAVLRDKEGKDKFRHEQNLIIKEKNNTLIMGCGHAGVVNIMKRAEEYHPVLCVGGFHLVNPITKKTVSEKLLDCIAKELQKYENTEFYTCHCTGVKAYKYLSPKVAMLKYLHCGDEIEI